MGLGEPANNIDQRLRDRWKDNKRRQNVKLFRSFVLGFYFILSVVEVSFVRDRRCHTERWLVGLESSCAFISFFSFSAVVRTDCHWQTNTFICRGYFGFYLVKDRVPGGNIDGGRI